MSTYPYDHAPSNDREDAAWWKSEFQLVAANLAAKADELRRFKKDATELLAALVEAAGGEIRVPRVLLLDPPDLLVSDEPTLEGTRVYRTRRNR